jgi:hypothetical protein
LSFIQLVEASLHGAAMEKPLLAAVVANETEPSVTNESFDRTTRHPSLLEHALRALSSGIKDRSN